MISRMKHPRISASPTQCGKLDQKNPFNQRDSPNQFQFFKIKKYDQLIVWIKKSKNWWILTWAIRRLRYLKYWIDKKWAILNIFKCETFISGVLRRKRENSETAVWRKCLTFKFHMIWAISYRSNVRNKATKQWFRCESNSWTFQFTKNFISRLFYANA